MAVQERRGQSYRGSNAAGDSSLASLACHLCRKRKVKCDHTLPVCTPCEKAGVTCSYPAAAGKPGPKIGSHNTKRQRLSQGGRWGRGHESPQDSEVFEARDTGRPQYNQEASRKSRRARISEHAAQVSGEQDLGDSSALHDAAAEYGQNEPGTARSTFSQIIYPSHESQTRQQSPVQQVAQASSARPSVTLDDVCEALKISLDVYHYLMESYFDNMTAFSLFRPNAIEDKFSKMRSLKEAESLVAAMFSFSARFRDSNQPSLRPANCPEPQYFAHIASTQLNRSLEEWNDHSPPFWLLQASVLVTFHQLTKSVRSRSWRTLGDCIRLAYDLKLHLIDAHHHRDGGKNPSDIDIERWLELEERRRAWWAIWEMDVFASTIRRLPTGIDWQQNMTLLPAEDHRWFSNSYQDSCFLQYDYNFRWKDLAASGNNSPRAWFIVINSLMRNTQLIIYAPGTGHSSISKETTPSQTELTIMANCLTCTVTSLPRELAYTGETLNFHTRGNPHDISFRQYHSDKYSIHLMTQLTRFMIHHHKICGQAPWLRKDATEDSADQEASPATAAWLNYMNAAEEITTVVRNSSREHYKYANPFLVNTVWFAAAAQCACKVYGPPSFDRRLASSNLDLLGLVIGQFITFWGSAESLQGSLAKMEAGLKSLMARESGSAREQGQPQDDPPQSLQYPSGLPRTEMDRLALQYASTRSSMAPPDSGISALGDNVTADPNGMTFISDPFELTQAGVLTDSDIFNGPIDFPYGLEEVLAFNGI